MILLLALLSVLCGEPSLCLEEYGGFTFDGDIRQFAVTSNTLYIATEERLYQLSHDLTLINSLTQRGILKTGNQQDDVQFYRVSDTAEWNDTFSINVLLPFTKNDSLISCGGTDDDCGHCDVLDLKNISKLLYREHIQVGPLKSSSRSVSFLVDVKKKTENDTYILTAIQKKGTFEKRCPSDSETINLHNTDNKQGGGLFSLTDGASGTPKIKNKGDVEFVDGFQIKSTIYLFSNVLSAQTNRVRLIWLKGEKSKTDTLKSLRGATLSVSDGESSRLVASSVIPGEQPVLWSGVFSVDGGDTDTELMVFDISPDYSRAGDRDPDFYTSVPSEVTVTVLKPKAVLFRHSYMTSVLAVRQRGWMVFFIGTGDGQLIKLSVDRKYHAACPTVLYRTSDDRKVIPKLHLDPVDRKHVYVPFRNQMKRVPVSKYSTYTNVQECWSAQDAYCGWCGSKSSCTFEDDCTDSDWLSIPDESQHKMISHKVEKDTNGQVLLKIHTHLTVGQKVSSNFTCQFAARSGSICAPNNPPPQFPQCTCILSDRTLPADGLHVTVKFRLGSTQLSEQLRLTNCSDISGPPSSVLCQQCVKAGCRWNINRCSWADQTEINDSVCQNVQSGKNFSIPEISSITPSVVSFYGRNHAVLSGRNLDDVTAVRIQADTDCTPKESPVWDNTGFSLMFHIPTSDIKGVVNVCLLLPDGRCHGKAKITYSSLPSCTNITPSSSWISGKRKITLMGSHLNFVEGLVHSHAMQDVRLPRNISSQYLTYDSPAARSFSSSTLFVKLANETLACSTKLSYVPDPEFTSFTVIRTGEDVRITIQKKEDNLEMMIEELSVWGVQDNTKYQCIVEAKETWTNTDFFTCGFKSPSNHEFEELLIKYGDRTVSLGLESQLHKALQILRFMLIPCVIAVLVIIYFWQKRLTVEMNKL
ncbi:plexin-C1-like isoform X1 [Oreochromis aureus]|uniref:Sema domain-containing protein n=1 Tax=Oreochromis aureus TaxID=47969 RepID=A0AAZ1X570_OREAU|nr:plexin-C1-like isoform X1 [Oreochromis aureus]